MITCETLARPVPQDSEDGFIDAYKEAFGGKPYYETYTREELAGLLSEHLDNGVAALARFDGAIAGFGCALPLHSSPQEVAAYVQEQISAGNLPADFDPQTSWYMSELGVLEAFRGRKIAYHLVGHRLADIAAHGGTYYVMRTAAEASNSRHLYEQIGAVQLSAVQDVSGSAQVAASQSHSTERIYLFGRCDEGLEVIKTKLGA